MRCSRLRGGSILHPLVRIMTRDTLTHTHQLRALSPSDLWIFWRCFVIKIAALIYCESRALPRRRRFHFLCARKYAIYEFLLSSLSRKSFLRARTRCSSGDIHTRMLCIHFPLILFYYFKVTAPRKSSLTQSLNLELLVRLVCWWWPGNYSRWVNLCLENELARCFTWLVICLLLLTKSFQTRFFFGNFHSIQL